MEGGRELYSIISDSSAFFGGQLLYILTFYLNIFVKMQKWESKEKMNK